VLWVWVRRYAKIGENEMLDGQRICVTWCVCVVGVCEGADLICQMHTYAYICICMHIYV